MCGIVGFIGAPSKVNRQIFRDMLMLDARRGPHSTGVAVASKKTAYTLKSTQLPWDLAQDEQFQEEIMGKNWPVMMGHNRFATLGEVNNDNAHPFWHGHIILTHNGTLTGLHRLDDYLKYDTDSEVFTYNLMKHGIEDTYGKTGGAMTFVWWDQKEKNLNVVSNGRRPFSFTFTRDKRTMFYASEEWMFRLACEARDVKLETKWFTIDPDKQFKFFLTRKGVVDYQSQKLTPWLPKVTGIGYQTGLYGDWEYDDDDVPNYLSQSAKDGVKKGEAEKGKDYLQTSDREFGKAMDLIPNVDTWKLRFGDTPCIICGCDMETEHKTALLIDCETVACGECADMCKQNHIELT